MCDHPLLERGRGCLLRASVSIERDANRHRLRQRWVHTIQSFAQDLSVCVAIQHYCRILLNSRCTDKILGIEVSFVLKRGINSYGDAVPSWGLLTQIPSSVCPRRGCGTSSPRGEKASTSSYPSRMVRGFYCSCRYFLKKTISRIH